MSCANSCSTWTEQRIVAPGYSLLQDTVGQALTHEQNRLITVVRTHLNDSDREAFRHLLDDPQGLYEITLLKREPKDFSLGEIKRETQAAASRSTPCITWPSRCCPIWTSPMKASSTMPRW